MRLDRFLSLHGYGSRKSAKKVIRDQKVRINGQMVSDYGFLLSGTDTIAVNGETIPNLPYITLMLNKPANYMCSLIDEAYPSVLNLIPPLYRKRVRLVGRLDADTTGLLLLTDNGILNSRLTNPKSRVPKTYAVTVNHILKPELVELFQKGVDIGQGDITAPAALKVLDESHAEITVTEGKYHEIKRLFGKFNYDVIALRRLSLGPLALGDLKEGEMTILPDDQYHALLKYVHLKEEDQL